MPPRAPLLLVQLGLHMLLLIALPLQADAIDKVSDTSSVLASSGRIRVAPGIAAIAAVLIGAVVCFFGYRLLRPAIFICGFLAGGLLVALIIEYAFAAMSWVALASWIGFLVAGGISGCVVLMMYNVGLFVIGALAGALLAFTLNTSFMYRLYPNQPDVMLVILIIVLALLGGVLAWKLEKPVIILATSFIGADAVVWGIGYFAGKYPSGADLKRFRYLDAQGHWVYAIPGAWWAYLTALVLLFLVGVYWQFRKSGKGVHYDNNQRTSTSSHANTGNSDYRSTVTPRESEVPMSHSV